MPLLGSEDMMMDVDPRTSPNLPDSSDDDLSSIASDDVTMMDAPSMTEPAEAPSRSLPPLKPTASTTSTSRRDESNTSNNGTAAEAHSKRKRLTASEKASKAEEDAAKKKEREDARQQKLVEKAKLEAEKAIKAAAKAKADAERQIARAKADAERAVKQAEREEKKRKKEEEERRILEEKERKERSQMRLNSFFKKPLTTKSTAVGNATAAGFLGKATADKATGDSASQTTVVNDYRRTFKPFFIKESVRMAPLATDGLDAARLEATAVKFDGYIRGSSAAAAGDADPLDAVHVLCGGARGRRRGMVHEPVKQLVEDIRERAFGDGGVERARAALARVPVKTLFFSTDVRPAYCGTVTGVQSRAGVAAVVRAGRRPTDRVFTELAYDYDSEAEWVDDEMGEDVDLDDDEEEIDDEDDMDGFLDDSEDAGVARGAFASSSMEPESTGVCFETATGETATTELYAYRMEFIMPSIAPTGSIDPFSTEYWDPEPKRANKPAAAGCMAPPPNPAPTNAFEALQGGKAGDGGGGSSSASAAAAAAAVSSSSGGGGGDAAGGSGPGPATLELRRPELLPEIKRVIVDNSKLSKLGLVDVLFHQIDGLTKGEAKMAVDVLAVKVGTGRVKQWALRETIEA